MKSLKILVTVIALGVAVVSAQAQEKKGQQTPEQRIEQLQEAVGTLTDDQKTKIKEIMAKTAEDVRALPKEERKEKGGEVRRAERAKIREVLTEEQKKKFDDMPQGKGKKKDN
jgi:hypothetical protein